MKDQKKTKKTLLAEAQAYDLIIDPSLDKYSGPAHMPEKVKKAEKKFSKHITHS
jgi:hypothetical protein